MTASQGIRRGLVLLAMVAALLAISGGVQLAAQRAVAFQQSTLAIVSGDQRHEFVVEIARTPDQLAYGLMFRDRLPAKSGMLFDYRPPQPVSMWMKNTLIPLDMIFIDETGRIVKLVERAVPQSTWLIDSGEPVRAVLELNGGTAGRFGIRVGDLVEHAIFREER